jgi:DNA-binding IclR family transcriptional regulator
MIPDFEALQEDLNAIEERGYSIDYVENIPGVR